MISERTIAYVKALLQNTLGPRSPIRVDSFAELNTSVLASASGVIKSDIDVTPYVLGLLYVEATFSAAANGSLTINVLARPPGSGGYSSEPLQSLVLAHNTASPFKRRGWLQFDVRCVSDIQVSYISANAAATTTIDICSLGLVL